MAYENAVMLVPGFFGFGRLGTFYYFADRVAACLRGAVEATLGRSTPVMGLATVPAGSLAERQEYLLSRLTAADNVLGRPARFHLVGHSAGGVDAELLRAEFPISARRWSDLDPNGVRARLATITTISAPHYGSYIADSSVVGFLRNPLQHLTAFPETSAVTFQLLKLAVERPVVHEALSGVGVRGWSDSARFLLSLLTDDKLLGDLRPESMERLRREKAPALKVPVTCFVTVVPNAPVVLESKKRKPDDFFEWIHRLTAHVTGKPSACAEANLEELNAFKEPVIRNPKGELPVFDPTTNDGVVNAMTQILRAPGARMGGIVLADHGDVIGHYDRQDPLTEGTPINDGVFRSGAGFGDDQFFELYGRVARAFQATY